VLRGAFSSMIRVLTPLTDYLCGQNDDGNYVHVTKERLMGMYMSVYVFRGCEHLVQGVDKDFVTAGLAGGTVGNKGGM
jgi:hypothetical protein